MSMRLFAATLLVSGVLSACHAAPAPRPANVMTQVIPCDTVPPPWSGRAPELPRPGAAAPGYGGVVGTVSERGTGHALPGSAISLLADTVAAPWSGPYAVPELAADSAGGFVLPRVRPGRYLLAVRAFNHQAFRSILTVRAGVLDTVRVELPYMMCRGY